MSPSSPLSPNQARRSHPKHGSTNLQQHQSQGISTSTSFHHQQARYTEPTSPQGSGYPIPKRTGSMALRLWLLRLRLPPYAFWYVI